MSDTDPRSCDGRATAPTIVALHFLGGSAVTWNPLIHAMAGRIAWLAVDLPGFGGAATRPGYTVAAMADHVADAIRAAQIGPFVLVGHSMGAKVACVLARRAEDGAMGLEGLQAVVLLAGSPPSPEPIEETKRSEMLGWFTGDPPSRREEATGFVRENVAAALTSALNRTTVDDVLRAERAAWVAWLESGSREDWAARVGTLRTPALIVAGEKDEALGIKAQACLMAPHFADARLHTLPGVGHLLPIEQPEAVAGLIQGFLERGRGEPGIDPQYVALLGSDRVSARTREVLLKRAEPVHPASQDLAPHAMSVLRAMVDRVIPQDGPTPIDIAVRIADALAGPGDGWRFADLPPDMAAYEAGLRTLDEDAEARHGCGFAGLDAADQDALLREAAEGCFTPSVDGSPYRLSSRQMQLWFEDVRAASVQAYVAHPATQARLGYSGIANRGDGHGPKGFVRVGVGEREPWEPVARVCVPR